MVWAFVVVAVAILYLALRYKRFQSWVEPVLTIVVAIGLTVAILVWFTDNRSVAPDPVQPRNVITPEEISLSDMQFAAGQPATSYRVTGTITNNSPVMLQSFQLTVDFDNCPNGACTRVGSDTALIIARVPPGQSQSFTTFVVFTGSDLLQIAAPKWTWSVSDLRALARFPAAD